MPTGGLRITTGLYGGRMLKTPVTHKLRPTRDMVRQAAFSMLQAYIDDWSTITAMDLFCGSGALGLEALSRGAKWCGFVDMYPEHVLNNIDTLKVPEKDFGVFRKNALNIKLTDKRALRRGNLCPMNGVDLVIADPPYALDLIPKLLKKNASLTKKGSIWLLESEEKLKLEKELEKTPNFDVLKEKTYGQNRIWLLRQTG